VDKKILIFGLPGSGKTTFAKKILKYSNAKINHYEADKVREAFNDWDFSVDGRERQNNRMQSLAYLSKLNNEHCILDFVNPYDKNRTGYDITIFMDTINKSVYDDTNKIFEIPNNANYIINSFDEELNLDIIKKICNEL